MIARQQHAGVVVMKVFRVSATLLALAAMTSLAAAQNYVPRRYRQPETPQPMRYPVSQTVPVSYFTGSWGQVSFNTEDDIPKMRNVARQYCGGLAVRITPRSPETFQMYVTTNLREVQVYEQNGQTFIIPVDQVSDGAIRDARELKVLDQNAFTLRYLQEEANNRYGPNLFVRCGSRDIVQADNSKPARKAKSKRRKR